MTGHTGGMQAQVFVRPERGRRRALWAALKTVVFALDGSYTAEGPLYTVGLIDERGTILYEERGYSRDETGHAKALLEADLATMSVDEFLDTHADRADRRPK